jgi:hypothetical protein
MRKALAGVCFLLLTGAAHAQQVSSEQELRAELARMKEQVARTEALLSRLEKERAEATRVATASLGAAASAPAAPPTAAERVRQQAPGMNTPPMLPPSRAESFRKSPPRIDVLLQVRGDFMEDTARNRTFFLRKAEVGFKGHIAENVDFSVEFDPVRPTDPLRRTYIRLSHFDKLHVKLGLEKAPLGLEELTGTARQPFVDRSDVNDRFAAAEELGVHFESHWSKWLFQAAITNGGRRLLRDDNRQKDVAGRVVWSPHRLVTLGAAALSGETGATRTARDRYNAELRLGSYLSGFQTEFYRAQDGAVLSSAYYLAGYWAFATKQRLLTHVQPVARYEFIGRSDRDATRELRLVTFGASFLFAEHNSKFQINYLKDLRPATTRRDELRAQYQVEF